MKKFTKGASARNKWGGGSIVYNTCSLSDVRIVRR